jgi:hypothetical protein
MDRIMLLQRDRGDASVSDPSRGLYAIGLDMLGGHLALMVAALFWGADLYINIAAQPGFRTRRPIDACQMEPFLWARFRHAGAARDRRLPVRAQRLVAEQRVQICDRWRRDDCELALDLAWDPADEQCADGDRNCRGGSGQSSIDGKMGLVGATAFLWACVSG